MLKIILFTLSHKKFMKKHKLFRFYLGSNAICEICIYYTHILYIFDIIHEQKFIAAKYTSLLGSYQIWLKINLCRINTKANLPLFNLYSERNKLFFCGLGIFYLLCGNLTNEGHGVFPYLVRFLHEIFLHVCQSYLRDVFLRNKRCFREEYSLSLSVFF